MGRRLLPPTHRVVRMSSTTMCEAPGDAELISAVRGGDTDAYGQLFERHVEAARRLARQLVAAGDVEDLVSEAFVKVLQVLQRGGGPDVAFRAYLLTAVRRLHVDRLRATSRLHTTDDMEMFDPGVPFRDTAVEGFESADGRPRLRLAARAVAARPVAHRGRGPQARRHRPAARDERQLRLRARLPRPRGAAPGLPHPARRRARRRGLPVDPRRTSAPTSATASPGATPARSRTTSRECRSCAAIYLELSEVNSNLGAVLAPLLLGGVAAAYAAGAGGAAAPAGLARRWWDGPATWSSPTPRPRRSSGSPTAVAVTGGGFVVWQDSAAAGRGVRATSPGPGPGSPDGSPAPVGVRRRRRPAGRRGELDAPASAGDAAPPSPSATTDDLDRARMRPPRTPTVPVTAGPEPGSSGPDDGPTAGSAVARPPPRARPRRRRGPRPRRPAPRRNRSRPCARRP